MAKKGLIKKIALLCAIVLIGGFSAVLLSSCNNSIDKYWDATITSDSNGKYVHVYGATKAGQKQEELFLPATMKGYPVKILEGSKRWAFDADTYEAKLGNVKRITIEGSVTIKTSYFANCQVDYLEFLSSEPPILGNIWDFNRSKIIIIVPEESEENYIRQLSFKRSEMQDGYLIKNNIFYGYCGDQKDIVIPEGVTKIWATWDTNSLGNLSSFDYIKYPIETVWFPTTLLKIEEESLFARFSYGNKNINYGALTKAYIFKDTIIERNAFHSSVEVIRYPE
ncbi:MAG: hypothetical protein LBT20_00885 [Clostridiales bacterium]|nr:hypothetical protein [Clostridiales bacterium]